MNTILVTTSLKENPIFVRKIANAMVKVAKSFPTINDGQPIDWSTLSWRKRSAIKKQYNPECLPKFFRDYSGFQGGNVRKAFLSHLETSQMLYYKDAWPPVFMIHPSRTIVNSYEYGVNTQQTTLFFSDDLEAILQTFKVECILLEMDQLLSLSPITQGQN